MTRPSEREDDRAELPVESPDREFDEIDPRMETVERVASVYYKGCRLLARTITTVKEKISRGD